MNSLAELETIMCEVGLETVRESHQSRQRVQQDIKRGKKKFSNTMNWGKWLDRRKLPSTISIERPDTYPNCAIDQDNLKQISEALKLPELHIERKHSSVYLIKCLTPDHWYVGRTKHVARRFESHVLGDATDSFVKGAKYTTKHGVLAVWATWAVANNQQADALEHIVYHTLKLVYKDFCISMGSPCECKT
jgi:predicted GIY-YIG superfamily endonuclease